MNLLEQFIRVPAVIYYLVGLLCHAHVYEQTLIVQLAHANSPSTMFHLIGKPDGAINT